MIPLCPGELQTNREIEAEMKKRGIKIHKTMNYADHYYRLGSVIRNTVSQAQDTLYRLKLGRERHRWIAVVDRLRPVQPAGPTQTLGELCIELHVGKILLPCVRERQSCGWTQITTTFSNPYNPTIRRDIQELREVMFHKHKDPKQERLYRLIDLVRTA